MHYIWCMELRDIGQLIQQTRKAHKLTQQQLGQPLGISRATISGIETGKIAEIGVRKLIALCAALGLEIIAQPRRRYPTLQELRAENHAQKRG